MNDNDKAGQDGLSKVIPRIGEYRCKIVKTTSEEIGKSYSHTVALHNQALEKFEETYKNLHYLT